MTDKKSMDGDQRLAAMVGQLQPGITCLDTTWQGSKHNYRFRCTHGHEWLRRCDVALDARSCPVCARMAMGKTKLKHENLTLLQTLALQRGGQCLDEHYLGARTRYHFRCAEGHEWAAQPSGVLRGSWCPRCGVNAGHQKTRLANGLERLQEMAAKRGGECLGSVYTKTADRYPFRCAKGHEWETSGARIVRGHWCPTCRSDATRLSLSDAQEAAKARGGECLSTSYQNTYTHMHWRCDRGHEWMTALAKIREGHWCRQCAAMARITNGNSRARRRYAKAGPPLPKEDGAQRQR